MSKKEDQITLINCRDIFLVMAEHTKINSKKKTKENSALL